MFFGKLSAANSAASRPPWPSKRPYKQLVSFGILFMMMETSSMFGLLPTISAFPLLNLSSFATTSFESTAFARWSVSSSFWNMSGFVFFASSFCLALPASISRPLMDLNMLILLENLRFVADAAMLSA